MSNIDRYRPAREGYQPPSLPPKPPPPIADRLSKSPTRRRDVPPPVPSPPTYSSRTSPPRPLSRRSAPSPAHSSPQHLPQARPDQWLFTSDELLSTPSIIDGLSVAEERYRRSKGVNFIYSAGILLDLPQITLYVAGVFFHRFYMRCSMVEEKGGIHHYNIAATSLFLANKTEENTRKTKDVIIAVAKVAQKNSKLIIDEQNKEYWRWRDSILTYEELMLEMLTFDLMTDNPYQKLFKQLGELKLDRDKPLRASAWTYCNDACLTALPLLMSARDIAMSAIFFATAVTHVKIDDINGEPWWKFLKGNDAHIIKAIAVMTQFYKDNPLQKKDPRIPGSPEFKLENTRRRGETITSQNTEFESIGTPMGTDRGGTQSPRAAYANGRTQGDDGTVKKEEETTGNGNGNTMATRIKKEDALESGSKAMDFSTPSYARGDSDAALKAAANDLSTHNGRANGGGSRSPQLPPPISGVKRRSVERNDDESTEAGERKKARVAEDDDRDEGEINGSSRS
ncbi:cyclin-like protein [Apodospora peruviana]|uniref:RNA polymerase II holoenzyme cyclin-like subunit n=1 Tax=Apodospora peruviana TaxID=516989 RepID=A0AAE0IR89_9PEZI|nr:cyclin-like protein [Apodospora peruviana]